MYSHLFHFINLFLLVVLEIGSVSHAQTYLQSDSIDRSIKAFMDKRNVPGFAACIVKNDSMVWSQSYGLADIKQQIPMSIEGMMNIGSISKTFTTTAIMQLWEKGLVNLEENINTYLKVDIRNPRYPNNPITISQILTHTSSIQDGPSYSLSYACGDPTLSLKEWIYANLTPGGTYYDNGSNFGDWAPGSEEQYSNIAFGLLGFIVETVAKQPFHAYCKEHIFTPLGMNNTAWYLSEIDTTQHIRPYAYVTHENRHDLLDARRLYPNESDFNPDTFIENCLYGFPNYPDGLVRTSISELSHFLIAILNGGEFNGSSILQPQTIELMLSEQDPKHPSQGLCFHTLVLETSNDPISLWGHTGGDPGITTFMFFDPESKLGVITFQNCATGGTLEIVRQLFHVALRK